MDSSESRWGPAAHLMNLKSSSEGA